MTCLTGARALLLAVAVVAAAPALAAPRDPAERRMVQTVRDEHERHVKLLEDLVKVNSGTLNLAGVERVGALMRAELEPLGFTVRWVPMGATKRAGHLIAEHKGNGRGKRMLLIGHLDTVFEPDSPFQGWTRRGEIVEGPGVGDMKGGLVIMVAALRAMQAAGALQPADITLVLTGDEEKPGSPLALARADLIAVGRPRPGLRGPGPERREGHRVDRAAFRQLLDYYGHRAVGALLGCLLRELGLWGGL